MPENLFLAYQRGAGERYSKLELTTSRISTSIHSQKGKCSFEGRHAYSHVNSLVFGDAGFLTLAQRKALACRQEWFRLPLRPKLCHRRMGTDERLRPRTATKSTRASPTPITLSRRPAARMRHFKLTRYLLRVTRDPRYGDSMERMMYNTILGALPLQRDGRSFYYSDYNLQGSKVYCDHRWPCCSGTHPQVAADYRINTLFAQIRREFSWRCIFPLRDLETEWAEVGLKQSGSYPLESLVHMEVTASQPTEFTLNLRIPAWAQGASASINGKRLTEDVVPGTFLAVSRRWKTGDRVELDMPLAKRLEPIDRRHPKTVALLSGPLVLFVIADKPPVVNSDAVVGGEEGQRTALAGGNRIGTNEPASLHCHFG